MMFRGVRDKVNRWRHRRGFGVHSPAAYMLVRDVVRPKRGYRYYAEDVVDVMRVSEYDRQLCRLSMRLIGRLGARHIRIHRPCPLVALLKHEKLKFRLLDSNGAKKGGEVEDVNGAPQPLVTFEFDRENVGRGEVSLYAGSLRGDGWADTLPKALYIEGRGYIIVYRTPGLTPLHVTV